MQLNVHIPRKVLVLSIIVTTGGLVSGQPSGSVEKELVLAAMSKASDYRQIRFHAMEVIYAARRGGDFFIISQGPEGQAGWAEQYDMNLQPCWGRTHEPPAFTLSESPISIFGE